MSGIDTQVGFKLRLDGDKAVVDGLDGIGKSFAVSADAALKLEKATASVAVAQAKVDQAIGRSAAAQAAYNAAVKEGRASQDDITRLSQASARAMADQAAALVSLKDKASGLKALEAAHAGVAAQTKLTGNQTAQLSAQLQDLFVQIQAGGSPMTALIQQGSQLSAVFGGFRPALAAVGSLFTPLVVGLGAAAAGVAALTLAYTQGHDEVEAYAKSLILSGNAAGETVGMLNESAKAMARIAGTQGKAAEVIEQLVSSGVVAAPQIDKITEAVIRMERAGGPAADALIKQFNDLGKSPADAVLKINEATNFLTISTFKQIKALEEQGKMAEAAAVAQTAYANAVTERSKALEVRLGAVQRVWRGIADTAKEAWDAMLGVGRQKTLEEQFAEAQRQLDAMQAPRNGGNNLQAEARRAAIKQRLEDLRLQILAEREAAATQEASAEGVKKFAKNYDDMQSAAKKAAEAHKKLIEDGKKLAADMLDQSGGLNGDFTEKWKSLGVAYKGGAISLEKLTKAQAVLLTQQPAMKKAAESAEKAAEAATKAYLEEGAAILDAATKIGEAAQQSLAAAIRRTRSLEDEATALALSKSANISLAEAVERVGLARLREQLDAANSSGNTTQINAIKAEIAVRERLIEMVGSKAAREANDTAAKEAQAVWERTFDQVGSALYDALTGNWASAKRLIESQIIRPVVQAVTGPVTSAVTNAITGTSNASTGASALSAASNASSLYGQAASAANYGAVYSGQAYGTGFATQQSSMLAAQEAGMTSQAGSSAMGTWGAYAGYAAMIYAAAKYASSLYNKGFTGSDQIQGKGWYEMTPEAMQTSVLKKLGLSDKWSEILGGSVRLNHMFGHAAPRVDQSGISGTFGNGGFTGQNYADITEKGGLFRSDKHYTQTAAMDDAIGRFFDDAAQSVYSQAANYGKALGLPAEQLAGVSTDIKLALTDDKDANMKAITDALSGYGDALVSGYAAAVAPLAKYGETTAQTIERVGTALGGVNDVLNMLGKTALAASIDGGKAAIELQGLFGGMDTLKQAASSYMQDFYTTAERAALTTKAVTGALAEVGLSMPATRAAFRSLVDAQDLTTDAGRRAFTALMGVESAFASVVPAADAAADAAKAAADIMAERAGLETKLAQMLGKTADLRERERAALDPSNRALYDQINALQDQKDAATAAANALASTNAALASLTDQLKSVASAALAGVDAAVSAQKDALTSAYQADVAKVDAAIAAAKAQFKATMAEIDAQRAAAKAIYDAQVSAINSARAALDAQAESQTKAYTDATKAVDAERKAAQAAYKSAADQMSAVINAAGATVDRLRGLNDSLRATLASLHPIGSEAADRARGQAQIASALAVAKASGVLPDADALKTALEAVSKPSEDLFGSFEDYLRDFYRTSIDIRDLSDIAGTQLDGAQTQLDATLAMRDALDAANDATMTRLDGIRDALDAANDLARDQIAAARDRLDGQLAGARTTYDTTLVGLDSAAKAAQAVLDGALAQGEAQKSALKDAYEAQLAVLTDILATAKAQLAAALGIDASVKSVAQALADFAKTLGPLAALTGGKAPDAAPSQKNQWVTNGAVSTYSDTAGAVAVKAAGQDNASAAIKGVNGAVTTISEAADFIKSNTVAGNAAVVAEKSAEFGISTPNIDALAGYTPGTFAALSGVNGATIAGFSVDDIRAFVAANANDPLAIYRRAVDAGITSATLDAAMGWTSGKSLAWALANMLPAFAAGGDHSGGLAIVGEQGPELVNMGPARVWNSEQTAAMLRNPGLREDALLAEVKRLRQEIVEMRSETNAGQQAIAISTGRTARVIADRWDIDGMPPTRTTT